MKKKGIIPFNLQFFAEPAAGGGSEKEGGQASGAGTSNNVNIDYDKIQKMLEGTLSAKEDTALKAYFKQQGLSQEEAEQAMAAFKAEKAKNQPDVAQMQQQAQNAQRMLQEAQIENAAMLEAVGMGLDTKTIPYVLKMADLSQAMGQDGKVNKETIKNALSKVLEDIPQLKPASSTGSGFVRVGGSSSGSGASTNGADDLKKAFGL